MALAIGVEASAGEEIWAARDGTLTLTLNRSVLIERGLAVEGWSASSAGDKPAMVLHLGLDNRSEMRFMVTADGAIEFLGRDMRAIAGLVLESDGGQQLVLDFAIAKNGSTSAIADGARPMRRGPAYFELLGLKSSLDRRQSRLRFASRELVVTASLANALGRPDLFGVSLGTAEVSALAYWIGGDAPARVAMDGEGSMPEGAVPGPDMIFCQLYGLSQHGRVGDLAGLSVATTSWNVGTQVLPWFSWPPGENHPFIVMDLFRLKTVGGSERFEQIGQSWIKHGWCAVDSSQCTTGCQGTGCSTLGLGCTDTYGAGLNASQGGLAPRFEVDPWARTWNGPSSHMDLPSHGHNGIEHRLQVHDVDLDPAQNAGATYVSSGYYVCPEDINQTNSAAWKPVTVSGSPGGTWSFGMSGPTTMAVEGQPIDAWVGATQTVLAQQVPVVEFVSPDGRCILASKSTALGGGIYHYEYALANMDMNRQGGTFSVPFPSGTSVTNVGFHAVEHHDEPVNTLDVDGVAIDNAVWTDVVSATSVTWSTTTNPLRWGTMYNFRFDADAAPGDVSVTLGLFRSGTPGSVSGTARGPFGPPPVCGDGNIQGGEECDPPDFIHCDGICQWICGDGVTQSGEECDPPDGTTCDANCLIIYICGDGITDPGEECDTAGQSATCDADCTLAVCGDGTLNTTAGEICDDGGESATCDVDCTPAACGDGTLNVTAGEQCDDGGTVPGDGCDATCQSESNDLCVNAIPICPGTHAGSTTGANSDGSATCGASASSPDVWYAYTPGSDGTVTIETCNGGNYDTVLSVHTGCPGTELLCNDDACPGTKSRVSGAVVAGTPYIIRVSGWQGATGDFVLDLIGPACGSTGTCGDGITDPGEDCDDGGESATCDADCTFRVCGDGTLNVTAGEQCDDGGTVPGDGCDANCQIEVTIPNDNCVDAQPIGDGATAFDTTGATTDGPAHVECNLFNYDQVGSDIWYCYTATCDGELTVSTCNSAAYDTKLALYDGCTCPPTAIAACDDDTAGCAGNTTSLTIPVVSGGAYLIRVGGFNALQGTGTLNVSCSGVQTGNATRGGQLWDKWWIVNGAPVPTGDHPLYPPAGSRTGSTTYRCKECHGWDYKGADGAYGSGSHFTGIPGVFGSTMTPIAMFNTIKLTTVANGHGFENYGLTDGDIWDLVQFLQDLVIDTNLYVDPTAQFIGDEVLGATLYATAPPLSGTACTVCHAPDGTGINFGTPQSPVWVGTIANANPWELMHKIRFGQPGTPMTSWLTNGGSDQSAADIGRYAQMTFPVDCTDASYCVDANPCTANSCDGRFCVDTPTDCSAAGDDCNTASCDPTGAAGNCNTLTPTNEGGTCNGGSGVCQGGICIDPGATRVFMVRAGEAASAPAAGPTSLTMALGTTVTVEMWAADTTPDQLNSYQMAVPGSATPTAGAAGTVSYVDNPDPAGGDSVFVDVANPAWVFFNAASPPTPFYSETGLPDGFALLAGLDLGVGVLVDGLGYLGEFQLTASANALGTFTLEFIPDGQPPNGGSGMIDPAITGAIYANYQPLDIVVTEVQPCDTATDCGDQNLDGIIDDGCLFYECNAGNCSSAARIFGDAGSAFGSCPSDGFANIHDRNHALTCFSGTNPCDPINQDLGGPFGVCPPDGFCNIHDANHALLAFAGTSTCSCPSGPTPVGRPEAVGLARLSAASDRRVAAQGEVIRVRFVLSEASARLRSYQLDVAVSGGRRGQLELVDIAIENTDDHVFANRSDTFSAVNISTGQMLSGLEGVDGVETLGKSYLATYTYRVSGDAVGTFVVDVARGGQTYLVTPPNGEIAVSDTVPAVIVVPASRSARVR